MGSRRKARECALQLLYQLDIGKGDLHQMIENFWSQMEGPVEQGMRDFSANLVEGVWQRKDELDEMIASYSTNWRISRMAAVDKNILRMAIFELIHCPDIPVKVTLNEAVEIAKRFGTAESGAFVNGILDNVAKDKVKDEQQA
jgi:N utilization substance protein B